MSINDGTLTVGDKKYQLITLDAETAYGKDYSLKKMAYYEYVRDPRFKVHGWAVKIGNGDTFWCHGEQIEKLFESIDWENTAVIAHNMMFDGFILSQHYKRFPGLYIDTLSMSMAVHGHHMRHNLDTIAKLHGLAGKEKVEALYDISDKWELTQEENEALGAYALDDVDDTYRIFWKMHPYFPDDEFKLVDLTMRMGVRPLLHLDTALLEEAYKEEQGKKALAVTQAGVPVDDLMSNEKFAGLLRSHGVEPPMKISPTTGGLTLALAKTDLGFQELGKHTKRAVRDLYYARIAVKESVKSSRLLKFIDIGKDGQTLPVPMKYSGAHTHRWSGDGGINLQNLPRGGKARLSILAPDGYDIMVIDSAQIEARTLAWLAGEEAALQDYRDGVDGYLRMAAKTYGIPFEQMNKTTHAAERFVGKIQVLGLGYGCGWRKFAEILRQGAMGPPVDISDEQAQHAVEAFRSERKATVKLWRKMDRAIAAMSSGVPMQIGPVSFGRGYCALPNGLFLHYPGMAGRPSFDLQKQPILLDAQYTTLNGRAKIYGGLLTENVVQALARIIVAEQMLKIAERGHPIVMMTHDEVSFLVPSTKCSDEYKICSDIMRQPPSWAPDLPLDSDGGWAKNYSK